MKTCFAPASDPETDMVDHNKYYPTISHSMTIRHTAKVPVYTQSHKTTKNPSLQMNAIFQEFTNCGRGKCTGYLHKQPSQKITHDKENRCCRKNELNLGAEWTGIRWSGMSVKGHLKNGNNKQRHYGKKGGLSKKNYSNSYSNAQKFHHLARSRTYSCRL